MPDKISVSGSLSHIIKVCENLSLQPLGCIGGWRSWVWLGLSHQLHSPSSVVRVTGARLALVCGIVVWVMPVGKVASLGWSVVMYVGYVMAWFVMGASLRWRVAQAAAVAGWAAQYVPYVTAAAPITVGMLAWLWLADMSPMSVSIVDGVWSVPLCVGVSWPGMRPVLVAWCSQGRNLVEAVLCKVAEFITAVTLCIRGVVAKMTCSSTNKACTIVRHQTDCGGCHNMAVSCCAAFNFSTNLMTSDKVWGSFS